MCCVGHAVDEEKGFIEFLGAIVLGAENEAEHGVTLDGLIIIETGGGGGKIRVTALSEKFPIRAE